MNHTHTFCRAVVEHAYYASIALSTISRLIKMVLKCKIWTLGFMKLVSHTVKHLTLTWNLPSLPSYLIILHRGQCQPHWVNMSVLTFGSNEDKTWNFHWHCKQISHGLRMFFMKQKKISTDSSGLQPALSWSCSYIATYNLPKNMMIKKFSTLAPYTLNTLKISVIWSKMSVRKGQNYLKWV